MYEELENIDNPDYDDGKNEFRKIHADAAG